MLPRRFTSAFVIRCSAVLALGALALGAQKEASGQSFAGSAAVGKMTTDASFVYDTGNALGGTVLSQSAATALGLGTLNADGTFTAPKGTATLNPNNGAYMLFCFPDVTVTAKSTAGTNCSFKQNVYVAQNQGKNAGEPAGNGVLAGLNVLNQDWINGVGASLIGAGAKGVGVWPQPAPPAPPKKATDTKTDSKTGLDQKTIKILLDGPTTSLSLDMVVQNLSGYSFVPQSVANELGLSVVGTVSPDAQTLNALNFDGLDNTGQTSFSQALLPGFSTGLGPDQSGTVLISNDSNSDFGVFGANFLGPTPSGVYSYVGGVGPNGNDVLAYVPEPSPLALLAAGCFVMVLGVRRRSVRGRPH